MHRRPFRRLLPLVTFTRSDGADPSAFVVSVNLVYRHLTESQRAMVAGKLENMRHGQASAKLGKFAEPEKSVPVYSTDAGRMLNVSMRSVTNASKVQHAALASRSEIPESAAHAGILAAWKDLQPAHEHQPPGDGGGSAAKSQQGPTGSPLRKIAE